MRWASVPLPPATLGSPLRAAGRARFTSSAVIVSLDREQQDALDHVPQFAHVAGPRVTLQNFHRFGGKVLLLPSVLRGDLCGKIFREDGNLFGPLPQRRQDDRKYVDAMKQIRAERSLPDHFLEIAMRCNNHARVHRNRLVPADALNFALLQNAQKFRLHGQGHVANFIQE